MGQLDATLDRITLKMTSSLRLPVVLGTITEGLVEDLSAAAVTLWLEQEGKLVPAVQAGEAAQHSPATQLPRRLAQVAADKQHLCTNDLPTDGSVGPAAWLLENGLRALAALPLSFREESLGILAIYMRRPLAQDEFERLFLFARTAAIAIANARLFEEVAELNHRLEAQNRFLESEIVEEQNCGGIVGTSPAIAMVLEQVDQVAATDATVLIEGETGTGKELVTRTIHERSSRKDRALVKVNCGAIAPNLVESELFGHEKGAFTGAIERRLGRFEVADGGTLFLDEVGELPKDVQVKLLRALQEQEFERVGSNQTQRVNVRIIAAGNRSLAEDVAAGRFRADLFYRLNVFPIRVPPLRDRLRDVPLIASCALPHLARRVGKEVHSLSTEAMARLQEYNWPGNVRELLNTLERSLILCRGNQVEAEHLSLPSLGEAPRSTRVPTTEPLLSLDEMSRIHILRVLAHTGWVIEGPNGAAKILGLHANTLRSRMTRLSIERPRPS